MYVRAAAGRHGYCSVLSTRRLTLDDNVAIEYPKSPFEGIRRKEARNAYAPIAVLLIPNRVGIPRAPSPQIGGCPDRDRAQGGCRLRDEAAPYIPSQPRYLSQISEFSV
jgi:hypothetical protein